MSAAREEILARIRRALADVPADDDVPVPRGYLAGDPAGTVERFLERVAEYGAGVRTAAPSEVAAAVADACAAHGVERVAVPVDFPAAWLPDGLEAIADDGVDVSELDALPGAVTGCALAIAETGTLVLDCGPRQGRRALTLVPDFHLCVVGEEQVVDGVPAALRRLAPGLRTERRPLTFVSGPSATSDIELARVEGVHGPRQLEIVVVRAA